MLPSPSPPAPRGLLPASTETLTNVSRGWCTPFLYVLTVSVRAHTQTCVKEHAPVSRWPWPAADGRPGRVNARGAPANVLAQHIGAGAPRRSASNDRLTIEQCRAYVYARLLVQPAPVLSVQWAYSPAVGR